MRIIEDIKKTDIFKELQLLHKTGIEKVDGSELSNSVVGRENINHFIKRMVEKAEKSVLIVTTKEGFVRKVNLLHKVLRKLNKKGVRAKIIAPVDEKLVKKVKDIAEVKEDDLNGRFVMADDELFFMLNDSRL